MRYARRLLELFARRSKRSTARSARPRLPWPRRAHNFFLPLLVEKLEERYVLSSGQWLSPPTEEVSAVATVQQGEPAANIVSLTWQGQRVEVFQDQWIVQLPNMGGASAVQAASVQLKLNSLDRRFEVMQQLGADGLILIHGPAGASYQEVSNLLAPLHSSLIEPNVAGRINLIPNDTSFDALWGMNNTGQVVQGVTGTPGADIHAAAAWDLTTGSSSVIVGLIDTGVNYTHPDLAANIFVNLGEIPGNGIDDDGNGFIDDVRGWDFNGNGASQGIPDNDPMDQFGHGTHVAGTIGAVGNNGVGVAGVAHNVKIMPLKIGGTGNSVSVAAAISALNYVSMMKDRGFNIVATNNSWGGGGFDSALSAAIDGNRSRGILLIASAGNGGDDGVGDNNDAAPQFPASYTQDNVIAVAATSNQDTKAGFSNYGLTSVDLGAPGLNIFSTMLTSGPLSSPTGYGYLSGTSMAAPHVTGAVAVLYAANPGATYTQIRTALLGGVDPVNALRTTGPSPVATGGRLNLLKSLQSLGMTVTTTNPAVNSSVSTVPLDYVVNFSGAVLASSVQASDFLVDGSPAASFIINTSTQVTFHYNTAPFSVQGQHTMSLGGGSVLRQSDNLPLAAFSGTFGYDLLPLQIVSTVPPVGSVITATPSLTFDVNFNEQVAPASVQSTDLVLSGITGASMGGTVTLLNGNTTARFTINGLASEGTLRVAIAAGAITDVFGNPNAAAFSGSYTVDAGVTPFPIPLGARQPLGSLVYDGTATAAISPASDTDVFTLSLDPGQSLTVIAAPVVPTLYGAVGNGGTTAGSLMTINPTTGTGTIVADPVTPGGVSGLAFDPSANVFFASTIQGSGTTSKLVRIDPVTGALLATVGSILDGFGGPAISIGDLAIQPGTGVLYGVRSNADNTDNGGLLYTINKTTGVATFIGDTDAGAGGGIAFASDGSLYQTAFNNFGDFPSLNKLNPADASRISTVQLADYYDGLAIRPTDGVIFASAPSGTDDSIFTINPITGAATFLGGTGVGSTSDLDFVVSRLAPRLQLLDPFGGSLGLISAAAGQAAVLQTIPATLSGTYQLIVSATGGVSGSYSLQAILNAAVENENVANGTNNTRATAQSLEPAFVNLQSSPPSGQRAAVLGGNGSGAGVPVLGFDFENGLGGFVVDNSIPLAVASGLWHLSTGRGTEAGHTSTHSFYYGQGETALGGGSYNTGGQQNAGSLISPPIFVPSGASLSFNYVLQTEELDPYDAAGVEVSTDGFATFTTLTTNHTDLPESSVWRASPPLSLAAFAGQTVQIRFAFDTVDGAVNDFEGWYVDDVQLLGPSAWNDYYSLSLTAGQTATIALKNLSGMGTGVSLEDASGALLAAATAGATNVDRLIADFKAPATGAYFIHVIGNDAATYNLLATKSASFDAEANDAIAQAQTLPPQLVGGEQYVLGHLGAASAGATLSFNELPTQPVNGLAFQGIHFGFTVGGVPSTDARYNSGGPGQMKYVQDPSLEGDAAGLLTLDFDNPTSVLKFGVALATSGTVTSAVVVQLFDASLNLISTIPVNTQNEGFPFTEAAFNYAGVAVKRAVLDFKESAAPRFVIDNLVFGGGGDVDYYRVNLNAASSLQARTVTPAGGTGQFVNNLDPLLRLYQANGTLVASDDNSADGRNAFLNFTNTGTAATFYLAVSSTAASATSGEYVLRVAGNAVVLPPFLVTATNPFSGATLLNSPATYQVDFNDAYLASTVQPSDLVVDGVTTATNVTFVDGDTISFSLPVLGTGTHTITLGAGVIQDVQGTPLTAFSANFTLDATPPRVIATSFPPNTVFNPGSVNYQIAFDEPMNVAALGMDDFSLRGVLRSLDYLPTSFSFDASGTVLTLSYSNLPEDNYALTVRSGPSNFTDAAGNPLDGEFSGSFPSGDGTAGGDFVIGFAVDSLSANFPIPLTPELPLGSLIYDGTATGVVSPALDTDNFTLSLDAGQTVSVLVTPGTSGLQPFVEVRNPANFVIGSAAASAPNGQALLPATTATLAGVYTLVIGGASGTTGLYSVQVTLNAALESEAHGGASDDTLATAQAIDGTAVTLASGVTRLATLGAIGSANFGSEDFESGIIPPTIITSSNNSFGGIL